MFQVKLESDFRDYYDIWFDHDGEIFRRVTTDGMDRPTMLKWLEEKNLRPPLHGLVKNIADGIAKLVVYTDQKAHRGEGKLLLSVKEALEKYPDHYASHYIESPSESVRLLQVGNKSWMLKYASDDKWRSNVGDVKINIISRNLGRHPTISLPLFAIDFVKDSRQHYRAIDFNIAPGIKWTGIEDEVKGPDIVTLIKEAVYKRKNV